MRKIDLAWFFTVLCAALYLFNIYLSTGIYDTSDGLAHFSIARYAPKHPELFLDHWGKPLFTTFAAPFAQFGLKGVMVMNTLLYVLTAYLLVSLARHLKMRFTWVIPILLAAIPVYFQVVMSGLTEVLFATVFVAGLWAFANERFILAALIITWLPFARSEAYFVVPWFALAFLFKRQWLAAVLLAIGPLFMSIIGFFVFDDFLWIVNNNPYTGAKEIYGSGEFWHFFKQHNSITGTALLYAAIAGMLVAFYRFYKDVFSARNIALMIAALSALGIFFGHSYFWANGLFGSLGLIRVMATIAPLFVLFAVFAISRLAEPWLRPNVFGIIAVILAYKVIMTLYWSQNFALKPNGYELIAQDLKKWYESSSYATNPNVWFMHPMIGYFLEIDDRDPINSSQLWNLNRIMPSNSIRENGLIVWDGHHAPSEGNTSLELLKADQNLKLVKQFVGVDKFNSPIELAVFVKETNPLNDTLVFENFSAVRPLLSGRINRIGRDTLGRPYFDMVTITHYMPVYTFWVADSAVWKATEFRLWFESQPGLQVWLSVIKTNGDQIDIPWHAGKFSLPQLGEDVINVSIALRNPDINNARRVYQWGLVKINE